MRKAIDKELLRLSAEQEALEQPRGVRIGCTLNTPQGTVISGEPSAA
jgi:hypothetical protein